MTWGDRQGGFGIRVSDRDGVRCLTLSGELDSLHVGELRVMLDACRGLDGVVVDTTGLSFINSTGLSAIVEASRRFGSDRFTVAPGPMTERLLYVTGTREELRLAPIGDEEVHGSDPPRPTTDLVMAERHFAVEEPAPERVRSFLAETLSGGSRIEDLALVGSELVTALLRTGEKRFTVRAGARVDCLHLEVESARSTRTSALEELRFSEIPLRVIEALSDRWGIELTAAHRMIWVDLARKFSPHTDFHATRDVSIGLLDL